MKVLTKVTTVTKMVEVKEEQKEINISLTEPEALRLLAICGSIAGAGKIRDLMNDMYSHLRNQLEIAPDKFIENPFRCTPYLDSDDVSFE
jgi:hypothetical protein